MTAAGNPKKVSLTVKHHYTASAERVFDAFLDPDKARRFMFATPPTGQMVRADIEPRVGGRFNFTDRRNGEDIEHLGEYLELNRPKRLVFTICAPKFSAAIDRVTIDIVPVGTGCELTLTHETAPADPATLDNYRGGWNSILDNLAGTLN